MTTIRVGKDTEVLQEQRFYSDTYLKDHKGRCWLFVGDAARVRTWSGRESVRTARDVLEFETEEDMIGAIQEANWQLDDSLDGSGRNWEPALANSALRIADPGEEE